MDAASSSGKKPCIFRPVPRKSGWRSNWKPLNQKVVDAYIADYNKRTNPSDENRDPNIIHPKKPLSLLKKIATSGYAVVENLLPPAECDKMAMVVYKLAESPDKKQDFAIANDSPLFRRLTSFKRVKNIAKRLKLPELAIVQSMIYVKKPFFGSEEQPESSGLSTKAQFAFWVWIALEDSNVDNGCLYIVPASHLARRSVENQNTEMLMNMPNSNLKPVPVRKGSCIIVHGNMVHCSGVNYTDEPTLAFTFGVVK